jgi:phosphatidate cytidylyltransferase
MRFPNLGKRLLVAIPAIPICWFLINSPFSFTPLSRPPIYPGHLFGVLLALLGCYEYIGMLRTLYPKNGFWVSYIWLGILFTLYLSNNPLPFTHGLYILTMLVALEAFAWGRPSRQRRWSRASLLFSGTAFMYIATISLMSFYHEPFTRVFKHFAHPMLSQIGIVLFILAVTMCDTFAYFVGCIWGKHHFSTISPKKTVEGAVGGFVAAVVITAVGWHYFARPDLSIGFGILLGVLIGVFAQVGDLFVSIMKRYFQVKDSSQILPGHGGILDRFGSIFFAAPAVSIFLWILNRFVIL